MDVSIQSVHLLNGDRALLRARRHLEGAEKTGQMARDMEQVKSDMGNGPLGPVTELFALPILPLFLLEKGADLRLPAGTKVTAYLNGDVPVDRTAFGRLQPALVRGTGPATITIFRENIHYASGNKPSVYCGKIALARLPSGGYLRIQLPPGKYSLRSNDEQAIELQLDEGQEVYVQMEIVTHGLSAKGHLKKISKSEGEDEIASLHELNDKDVATISGAALSDLQAMPEKK